MLGKMKLTMAMAMVAGAMGMAPALAQNLPAARSYADPASWICRPNGPGVCGLSQDATIVAASGMLTPEPWHAAKTPAIDCLYFYPTISDDPGGNSDMNAGPEEKHITEQQFARLGSQCRTFAPVWRSRTATAMRAARTGKLLPTDNELPYLDIRAAFRHYLAHDNHGRGFVLIGHSQGSAYLVRLLREEIDGKPVQKQLVSAMPIGIAVLVPAGKDVGGDFQHIPLCRAVGQTGCVISYSSYRADSPPPKDSAFGRTGAAGMEIACTNPAALSGDGEALRPYFATQSGLVPNYEKWEALPGRPVPTRYQTVPGLVTARCAKTDDGGTYLAISIHPDTSDPRADNVPGDVLGAGKANPAWGMHMGDIHLAIGNLEKIVGLQAKAFTAAKR
jgi:hypothetical protein